MTAPERVCARCDRWQDKKEFAPEGRICLTCKREALLLRLWMPTIAEKQLLLRTMQERDTPSSFEGYRNGGRGVGRPRKVGRIPGSK